MRRRSFHDEDMVYKAQAIFFNKHDLDIHSSLRKRLDSLDRDAENPYPDMFLQDVVNKIIPYKGGYKFTLTTPNEIQEIRLASAFLSPDASLTEAAEKFIRNSSFDLLKYEQVFFDVVVCHSTKDNSYVGFELRRIPPLTVKKRLTKWVQYIPDEIANEFKVASRIELTSERLVVLKLPRNIRDIIRHTLENLSIVGKVEIPDFVSASWRGESGVSFNQSELSRSKEIAFATATKEVGWNCRNYYSGSVLEFYELDRFLRFAMFTANLRNLIMTMLNSELSRIESTVGFLFQLQLTGLSSVNDLHVIRDDLYEGKKPLKTILNSLLTT
ncbi:hypothetical protein [Dendrosporobacter sp. 1207_IL3150]|uniref:hypothetical protein n=1 Tax=Dendrosporobacter sp. 1207_IL3150 TaxID=3084054 RepID=UPI002FD988B1